MKRRCRKERGEERKKEKDSGEGRKEEKYDKVKEDEIARKGGRKGEERRKEW